MPLTRREFIGSSLLAAVPARAQTADARIEVLVNEPVGTIAPEIYGHFVEHLGGVVYDGIWVGEDSKIANTGGIRTQLVEAFRKLKPSVVRWPGGCFADQYDWHDGIGPRGRRPKRTNFWVDSPEWPKEADRTGPQVYDPNSFGTTEFVRFCQLSNAQPYIAANVRSLRPQDFWQWVEYCNSPAGSTALAEQRATDGSREPMNVRFWGVGNESWGCGGNFTPEEYATEFRRFSAWVPRYGVPLSLIGSGPNGADISWTREFFPAAAKRGGLRAMWGWALHHYAWNVTGGRTTEWLEGKGDALKFPPDEHYELLREASLMEQLITSHWAAMGETDREHRVKLVVDEWGAWYRPGTEPFPEALIGQQNTMRDAVLAGLTLDIFHRHAEKVAMAAIAQLVNCLQSLFLAHGDRFCVTPTYHVFDMYAAHQGAQALRTLVSTPSVGYTRNGKPASLARLAGSASLKEKTLVLTVTNSGLDQPVAAEIAVRGAVVRGVKTTVLNAPDVYAHNSLTNPNAVAPKTGESPAGAGAVSFRFAPASVTKLEIALG
jgi:alpha-N-arabinofuranosidase